MEAQRRLYVGVDLHRKRSVVAALDEAGTPVFSRRIESRPAAFERIFGELAPASLSVAFEATYGWRSSGRRWSVDPTPRLALRRSLHPTRDADASPSNGPTGSTGWHTRTAGPASMHQTDRSTTLDG
jgi:hypothetical protein